ncbi:MAG: ABC transporter ATP-binding protein [bacterium]
MTGNAPAIEVRDIHKRFEDVRAVDGIFFTVRRGEIFGFLGPNGAGKTTTINLLTGLARPDAGTVGINGVDCTHDPKAAQRLIGVVPDTSNLYPELTGFENLCFCGALYGMRKKERRARARKLLDFFGLVDAASRRFVDYSRGMKRRLAIAAGIIHEPPILFLDEPTTGIDVSGALQIRRLISDLHESGTTIFLTTHYIEEAERLCDRVAFIVAGRIVGIDTVARFIQPVRDKHVLQISCAAVPDGILEDLARSFTDLCFQDLPGGLIRVEAESSVPVGPLVRFLEERGIDVTEARRMRPSLEDVFIQITGIEAAAMQKEKEKKGIGR